MSPVYSTRGKYYLRNQTRSLHKVQIALNQNHLKTAHSSKASQMESRLSDGALRVAVVSKNK